MLDQYLLQLQDVVHSPRVHGSRLCERHRKLRAALHLDHSEAGERVDLKQQGHQVTDWSVILAPSRLLEARLD